jgi:hypothetical protein
MLVFGFGMGLDFVAATVTAVSGVVPHEAGAASGLLNAMQQVGGSLGLSVLTTVFGSAGKDEAKKQLPKFLATARPNRRRSSPRRVSCPHLGARGARAVSTAFFPAAVMAGGGLLTAWLVIKVRKSDLEAVAGTAGPGMG